MVRSRAQQVVEGSPLWDRRDWVLQVVDMTESTMVVRILASAHDGPSAWDLRCEIREELLRFVAEEHPEFLPRQRVVADSAVPVLAF